MSSDSDQKNPLEYISLSEASKESGYTPEYLNSLARQGKLTAKKIGRNWYTTSAWLGEFILTTKSAKKEKIEKLDFKIHEYTNGAMVIPEEITTSVIEIEPDVSQSENKDFPIDDEISEKAERRFRSRWKTVNVFAATLAVVFLLVGVFQAGRFIKLNNFENINLFNGSSDNYANVGEFSNWISAEDGGVVKAAEITNTNGEPTKGTDLASENFKIKEIKFGGAIAMASGLDNPNFEIYDIRSDLVKTSSKEENKLMIKWRTNKLALSTIEYSTMSGANPKKLREENYGFGHSVILSDLEPGTAYTYVIKGEDKWANEISSDRYSAYTGTKTVSVFDLIVNAVKEVFGWAVKK